MFTLDNVSLPDALTVTGKSYSINTDFRFFLKLSRALKKKSEKDINALYNIIFFDEKPEDTAAGFKALLAFYNPPRELPREQGDEGTGPVMDYDVDAPFIYAAFLQQYKIDLFEIKRMHWWKFLALLGGLRETKLTDIIGYRMYEYDGKPSEYTKQMLKIKAAWKLEAEEDEGEEDEALAKYERYMASTKKG